MGTEVLRPHDCLVDRLRFSPPELHRRRTPFLAGNGFVSPKPNNRKTAHIYRTTEQQQQQQPDRKRKPIKEFQQQQRKPARHILSHKRSSSAEDLLQNPVVQPGRITILRRGQSLESFEKKIEKEALKIKKTQNGSITTTDVYAGSGFFVSPSPNSLPLPSFFSSNRKSESDICATRDLRRMLGLDY